MDGMDDAVMDGMHDAIMDGVDESVLARLSEAHALHGLGLLVVLQCLGARVSPHLHLAIKCMEIPIHLIQDIELASVTDVFLL